MENSPNVQKRHLGKKCYFKIAHNKNCRNFLKNGVIWHMGSLTTPSCLIICNSYEKVNCSTGEWIEIGCLLRLSQSACTHLVCEWTQKQFKVIGISMGLQMCIEYFSQCAGASFYLPTPLSVNHVVNKYLSYSNLLGSC